MLFPFLFFTMVPSSSLCIGTGIRNAQIQMMLCSHRALELEWCCPELQVTHQTKGYSNLQTATKGVHFEIKLLIFLFLRLLVLQKGWIPLVPKSGQLPSGISPPFIWVFSCLGNYHAETLLWPLMSPCILFLRFDLCDYYAEGNDFLVLFWLKSRRHSKYGKSE